MKRTANFLAPLATRLAVLTFALTAVLSTPMTAKPNAVRNNAGRSAAPQRQAARPNMNRPNTASRPNMTRPNTASRPNMNRPNTASRPNTTRPNATQSKPGQSNTTRPNNSRPTTSRPNSTPANAGHGATPRGSSGQATNLHGGRQIADTRFHSSFGSSHQFRIGHPLMIGGQASFQFGGLWFGIVEPWPAAWLYTDAVYVDFIAGGYFLVNVLHPGVLVAVAVGDAVPAAPAVCAPAPAPAVQVSSIRLEETSEPVVVVRFK